MARRETRAVRAAELLERLERGPSFGEPTRNGAPRMMSADAATRAYRLWVASWILDELRDLVPELRPPRSRYTTRPSVWGDPGESADDR